MVKIKYDRLHIRKAFMLILNQAQPKTIWSTKTLIKAVNSIIPKRKHINTSQIQFLWRGMKGWAKFENLNAFGGGKRYIFVKIKEKR